MPDPLQKVWSWYDNYFFICELSFKHHFLTPGQFTHNGNFFQKIFFSKKKNYSEIFSNFFLFWKNIVKQFRNRFRLKYAPFVFLLRFWRVFICENTIEALKWKAISSSSIAARKWQKKGIHWSRHFEPAEPDLYSCIACIIEKNHHDKLQVSRQYMTVNKWESKVNWWTFMSTYC